MRALSMTPGAVKQRRYRNRYAADPEFRARRIADAREWAAANPDRLKDTRLRRDFGISLDEFEERLERQAGLCAICTRPMKPGRDTCMDHDHVTGRVRMILCRPCNTRLGRTENETIRHADEAYREMFSCP